MGHTAYSHDVRLVVCEHCGAPVEVELAGGAAQCAYCGAHHQVARRDETEDRTQAQQSPAAGLGESERVERLRGQVEQQLEVPPSLIQYGSSTELALDLQEQAHSEWLTTLRRVKASAPFSETERLFHLTRLLAPKLDDRRKRAFLEQAVELLPDPRHRQVFRCSLAEDAVRTGDLSAADRWLESCQSKPLDLLMDSAFRVAASFVATARGDFHAVLNLLGYRSEDIPFSNGYEAEALVLRSHALENTGSGQQAVTELEKALEAKPRLVAAVDTLVAAYGSLGLCRQSYPPTRAGVLVEFEQRLRPIVGSLAGPIILALIGIPLLILTFVVPLAFDWDNVGWIGISVNTAWTGAALTAMAVGFAGMQRKRSRLRHDGIFTFARVVSLPRKNPLVQVQHAGQTERFSVKTISGAETAGPGVYPCLFDATKPSESILLVGA